MKTQNIMRLCAYMLCLVGALHADGDGQDLFEAAKNGDITKVKAYIRSVNKVDVVNKDGTTALMIAIFNNKPDIVRILLANGSNINHANNDGDTPLIAAAMAGNTKMLALVLEQKPLINAQGSQKATALFFAIGSKPGVTPLQRTEGVSLLLRAGANVDIPLQNGVTPLMSAAGHGPLDLVKLIVEKNPNINARNGLGYTALKVARESGNKDIANFLIKNGAKE